METAQIAMMPTTVAAVPAGGLCGLEGCSGAGFGSLLGQAQALLSRIGVAGNAAKGTLAEAEAGQQAVLPTQLQEMPEVAFALPQPADAANQQQPVPEAGDSLERAQQLAGFLQAAMVVPATAVPLTGPSVDGVSAIDDREAQVSVQQVATAADQPVADDQQVPLAADGRAALKAESLAIAGRGVETQYTATLAKPALQEAATAVGATVAQKPEQQMAMDAGMRTEMAKGAAVAAAAVEGKPTADYSSHARPSMTATPQRTDAQPLDQVAAAAQPEHQRRQDQGQLGQQQAGLGRGNTLETLMVSEQPDDAPQFQLRAATTSDLETPQGHSMGVTIQRMAGGQLEVQAAEPAKVAAEAQLMRQVSDRLETHDLKQGTDRISLRLSPEHLGNLQLNLRMEDQQVRVEIVAEHRAVRDALLQQVDQLKETLLRQNIKMESFDVTTANNGGLTQQQQQGFWRQTAGEQHPRHAQNYGSAQRVGRLDNGIEPTMQYFAPQYQSTLDLRF